MAYLTGQIEQGWCKPGKYLGNGVYECSPELSELHRINKNFNDCHMWHTKIVGKKGEKVTIRLNWHPFIPQEVSEEYKNWDSYSTDWPNFFDTVPELIYYSTDQKNWTRLENVIREDYTLIINVELTQNVCYLCSTLYYTVAMFEELKEIAQKSPDIEMINLGVGWNGDDLYTFVATDKSVPASEKKTIYFQGAQHCQEHPGIYVCDNMLRYLAQDTDEVRKILKKFIFRITPIVDIAGWRSGSETHPMRTTTVGYNYNRDWDKFEFPEVKLIADYLLKLKEEGENIVFLADVHGGLGDERDYVSGASIAFDSRSDEELIEKQKHFIDMVRQECDYLNPQETNYFIYPHNDAMFTTFANNNIGPGYTFEVSYSKIWDREKGKRFPNTQKTLKRFSEQLINVIVKLESEE